MTGPLALAIAARVRQGQDGLPGKLFIEGFEDGWRAEHQISGVFDLHETTIALLAALGVGRAQIGSRNVLRTVAETVSMGIAAALAGVAIGMLINRGFGA